MTEQETKPSVDQSDHKFLALLALFAFGAAASMGYVLGWLTGVSESPVANVAITGLFGAAGALGAVKALDGATTGHIGIIKAICVAISLCAFCWMFYWGLLNGAAKRNSIATYKLTSDLVGDRMYDLTEPEIVAELNAFRIRARLSGVKPSDYGAAMIEVVSPIINDDKPDRLKRLREALDILESPMTKREPKADEKPKAEPAKKPASEPAKGE